MVVNELASRRSEKFSRHKSGTMIAQSRLEIGGPKLILAKSTGYMNVTGGPVSALMKFYSLKVDQLVVVHDELDIPFDTIRIKRGGGEGGHNGLKSISQALGSRDYLRVRAGIGRPPGQMPVPDYVLRPFSTAEKKDMPLHLDRCADAVEKLLGDGLTAAQNSFHSTH